MHLSRTFLGSLRRCEKRLCQVVVSDQGRYELRVDSTEDSFNHVPNVPLHLQGYMYLQNGPKGNCS